MPSGATWQEPAWNARCCGAVFNVGKLFNSKRHNFRFLKLTRSSYHHEESAARHGYEQLGYVCLLISKGYSSMTQPAPTIHNVECPLSLSYSARACVTRRDDPRVHSCCGVTESSKTRELHVSVVAEGPPNGEKRHGQGIPSHLELWQISRV